MYNFKIKINKILETVNNDRILYCICLLDDDFVF